MQVYTHDNRPITLTDILGRGGEATIYAVFNYPNQVAKIYHTPTPEREAKLQAMLANPPQQPATHTAIVWPTELLYQDNAFKGFLMPKITSPHIGPIFDIYNPARRRMLHPKVDLRLLYQVALELVNTVAAIHAKGHVIDDVNESNILVYLYRPEHNLWTQLWNWWQERDNITPYVTFVDTDSFQIQAENGTLYRSLVAKPEYTPPELHGIHLRDIDQRVEHDMFRVAVLLFQLLMEGLEQTMIIGAAKRMEMALKFTGSQLTMSDLSLQAKARGKVNLVEVYGKIDLQRCGFFRGNYGLKCVQNSSGEVQTCRFEDNVAGICLFDQAQMTLHDNLCQNNYIAIHYNGQAGGLAQQNRCIGNDVGIAIYANPILAQNECRQNKYSGIDCKSKAILRANECHENRYNGIRVSSPDVLIERNHCTKNGQDGLECSGYGMRSIINGNVCRENGRHGISVKESAAPTLSQNICQLNPQTGLSYQDAAAGTASENQCSQNGMYGIRVVDRATPTLERNVCQQNKSHGLSYLGQAAGVARHNRCHQNGMEGIRVEGQAALTLSDNLSQQNQRSGLVYAGKSAGEAKGNHCIANGQAGIRVIGQAQPLLEGNYCQLNQGAAISYEGQAQGIARQNRYISNGADDIKLLGTAHPQLTDNAVDSMTPLNLLESLQPDHISTMIAQAADGATLELPPGEHRLSQMLELTKSMHWIGAGRDKTIIIGQPQAVIEIKNSRFSAQGITFRYEYDQGAQQTLMTLQDSEINLTECHFDNGLYGLLLQGNTTGTVTNCKFTRNHVGLRLIDQVTPQLQDN